MRTTIVADDRKENNMKENRLEDGGKRESEREIF